MSMQRGALGPSPLCSPLLPALPLSPQFLIEVGSLLLADDPLNAQLLVTCNNEHGKFASVIGELTYRRPCHTKLWAGEHFGGARSLVDEANENRRDESSTQGIFIGMVLSIKETKKESNIELLSLKEAQVERGEGSDAHGGEHDIGLDKARTWQLFCALTVALEKRQEEWISG
ncbi:hypothetical protein AK812_SmicGene36503 [Symbiodinium microadriaticum]|uniref:Uncharacterized protein n=1 Tax=Symbiodinium microadriaticum TaxID=2951 RepID=A0A1Q9CIV6_SYMMI|nr:hypothetical protein AK812_SmicGene36503 [Symbiodinium microadriaticum]